jgi:hypothetical protein
LGDGGLGGVGDGKSSAYFLGAKCGRCGLWKPTARNHGRRGEAAASVPNWAIALAAIIPSGTSSSAAVAWARTAAPGAGGGGGSITRGSFHNRKSCHS